MIADLRTKKREFVLTNCSELQQQKPLGRAVSEYKVARRIVDAQGGQVQLLHAAIRPGKTTVDQRQT